MRLIIAEKPSLGRAIAEAIGKTAKKDRLSITLESGDVITWAAGHILKLREPEDINPSYKNWKLEHLPIIPSPWEMKPKEESKDLLENIGKLLKKADVVVNAGDADREGQLLIDEILEYCNYKGKVLRILVTDMNASAIQKALAEMKPNEEYKNISHSALARSRADWLLGMNLTRLFTVTTPRDQRIGGVISVGRVQTPTLALVVNNDRLIENFQPTPYYLVKARSIITNGEFVATWKPSEEQEGLDSERRIVDVKIVETLENKLKGKVGHVTNFKKGTSLTQPPLTYSLPALQIDASKVYGMSPEMTLKVLQTIYEAKYVTYPRSDCGYLSETLYDNRDKVLAAIQEFSEEYKQYEFDMSLKTSAWNTSKTAEHHGIIPTGTVPQNLSEEQKKIYDLIAKRYAAQFLPPQEFAAVEIEYKIEDEIFGAKARQCTKQGWHALYSKVSGIEDDKEAKDKEESSPIPDAVKGEGVGIRELIREDKKTTPPKRFTEASLLSAMNNIHHYVEDANIKKILKETQGIGTAATQANVIATLITRGYIEKDKKALISTPKGRSLIDAVDPIMRKADTTALWEQSLAEVEGGRMSMDDFIADIIETTKKMIDDLAKVAPEVESRPMPKYDEKDCVSCVACGEKTMRQLINKNGNKFWACAKCNAMVGDDRGKPQKAAKCPSCGEGLAVRIKRKDGKYFWKCRKCEQAFNDDKGKPVAK